MSIKTRLVRIEAALGQGARRLIVCEVGAGSSDTADALRRAGIVPSPCDLVVSLRKFFDAADMPADFVPSVLRVGHCL